MKPRATSHVFGAVPSRRLGRSLGVDLTPFKTCTYDCVYCQLGRTTNLTIKRHAKPAPAIILKELRQKLHAAAPDFITLSGSGEPTLYLPMAELIHGIKRLTSIPVAILTNASLLWDREVQNAASLADLVIPSLDAGDETVFQKINRPHPDISFERMAEGIAAFRRIYKGRLWLEIFLLRNLNATDKKTKKIAEWARRIKPDKIQINTVSRPPAEAFACAATKKQMLRLAADLGKQAEVIADYSAHAIPHAHTQTKPDEVLSLLHRRPCTVKDIAAGLALHPTQAAKLVELLLKKKLIVEQRKNDHSHFYASRNIQKANRAKKDAL